MTLRVVHLEAENFRRLRAVEIDPDPNVVVLTGDNAQGKSSVLDAIWAALGGGAAMKEMGTTEPIHHGQEEARVMVDLGELKVTRTWDVDSDRTTLIVESADGARFQRPQQMLDGLLGRLSFDPLAFASMKPRDQLAELVDLVELPFDPAVLDGQRLRAFEARTEVGREARTLASQIELIPEIEGVPEEEQSAADIVAEMNAAREIAEEHAAIRQEAIDAEATVEADRARVEELSALLERATASLDQSLAVSLSSQAAAQDLPADPDMASFDSRLTEVDAVNTQVRAMAERRRLVQEHSSKLARQQEYTEVIDQLDAQRAEAVAAATMPVPGLDFGDGHVIYQGAPFQQASAAEQLRVSVAMAMAANPKVRIIRVENASLLDDANMAVIADMARDGDFQIWFERIADDGPAVIHIEDGSVVTAVITSE